jgi:hypothetical protein
MSMRISLGDMFGAGLRALSRYTGTLFAVFITQSLVAAACLLAVAVVLAQAFSHMPLFDQAVDGDLVALLWCLRHGRSSFFAIGGIVFGALLFWQLASWFLAGGLYGVLAQRPETRGDTARCFGASGAATYLAYARLALCSIPGWIIVLFVFGTTLGAVAPKLEHALTVPQLLGPLAMVLIPTVALLMFFWTVADYARVELTLRHETHGPGVFATYFRSLIWVAKRPLSILHAGFGWFVFALVTLIYLYVAQGHPMYGTEGAITLFAVRQGVSLLRMAVRVGVMGGQIELGRTRPLPPKRVEVKASESRE